MEWQGLKKFVGIKTALINKLGNYVDGIVSEADLEVMMNIRFKNSIMKFAEKFPEHYEVMANVALVADQYVYKITGEAIDNLEIRGVWVKYLSETGEHRRAKRVDRRIAFENEINREVFDTEFPKYILRAIKDTETDPLIRSIELLPTPTEDVDGGLKISYVEIPDDRSDTNALLDPLPSTYHHIIGLYTISDVWEIKGDWNKAERAMNRAMYEEKQFFDNYQPLASDEPAIAQPDKSFMPNVRNY